MYAIPKQIRRTPISKKATVLATDSYLHKLVFDNTAQANIVSTVEDGKMILVNDAACKLLGYSKRSLLSKNTAAIFHTAESNFKKMLKQRTSQGHCTALVTGVKKSGRLFFCRITSTIFREKDGVEKSISNIADMNMDIQRQNNIDKKKAKTVADNIMLAKVKSNVRLKDELNREIRLKEKQIEEATQDAKETERSDIAKELHDNINQLLAASKMYIDMAKRGGNNCKIYLNRSSQYTLEAIEEIRKLTKGLTSDVIQHLGLCEALKNICQDTMETNPIKLSMELNGFNEYDFNDKFKLNVYRIVQEQVNNILKHARATGIVISLKHSTESLVLTISDNGIGFDTCKKQSGIGLTNIKSRARAFKGIADFTSLSQKGCTLTVTFPVTAKLLNPASISYN